MNLRHLSSLLGLLLSLKLADEAFVVDEEDGALGAVGLVAIAIWRRSDIGIAAHWDLS
jgi:hypothetical protein